MSTAIETEGLSKTFKGKTAVDHLNLSIKKNELFGLLGVNGAGKTTTIKMLCRLMHPDSGKIKVHGEELSDTEAKQIINFSPQETAVAPNLTVKENLELMAAVQLCALDERRGDAGEKLLCEEDVIRGYDAGQDERGVGVGHIELVCDEDVQRHLRDLIGYHHRHEDHRKHPLAPLEVDLREGVARHGREDDVADDRRGSDDEAVEDPASGVFAEVEEGFIRIKRPLRREYRPRVARGSDRGAEGGHYHIEDREQRQHREQHQQQRDDRVSGVELFTVVQMLGI